MGKISKLIITQIFTFIILVALSIIWWNLWMYQGMFGSIPILHWRISVDGEASYDLTFYEMFFHLLFVYILGFIVFRVVAKLDSKHF